MATFKSNRLRRNSSRTTTITTWPLTRRPTVITLTTPPPYPGIIFGLRTHRSSRKITPHTHLRIRLRPNRTGLTMRSSGYTAITGKTSPMSRRSTSLLHTSNSCLGLITIPRIIISLQMPRWLLLPLRVSSFVSLAIASSHNSWQGTCRPLSSRASLTVLDCPGRTHLRINCIPRPRRTSAVPQRHLSNIRLLRSRWLQRRLKLSYLCRRYLPRRPCPPIKFAPLCR